MPMPAPDNRQPPSSKLSSSYLRSGSTVGKLTLESASGLVCCAPERDLIIGEVVHIHARDGVIDPSTKRIADECYRPVGRLYSQSLLHYAPALRTARAVTRGMTTHCRFPDFSDES